MPPRVPWPLAVLQPGAVRLKRPEPMEAVSAEVEAKRLRGLLQVTQFVAEKRKTVWQPSPG